MVILSLCLSLSSSRICILFSLIHLWLFFFFTFVFWFLFQYQNQLIAFLDRFHHMNTYNNITKYPLMRRTSLLSHKHQIYKIMTFIQFKKNFQSKLKLIGHIQHFNFPLLRTLSRSLDLPSISMEWRHKFIIWWFETYVCVHACEWTRINKTVFNTK